MYDLINVNNRNDMIMKYLDYHDSHNIHSKGTFWVIKSSNSRGLLKSVNSALLRLECPTYGYKKLPLNDFVMLSLDRFKFQSNFHLTSILNII